MGSHYYIACLDCLQRLGLGKFWDWSPARLETLTADTAMYFADCTAGRREAWISMSIAMHAFLQDHLTHRIWVGHENDPFIDDSYADEQSFYERFTAIAPK